MENGSGWSFADVHKSMEALTSRLVRVGGIGLSGLF